MKQPIIPVKILKHRKYVSLLEQLNNRHVEIKAATEFVKAIERGELDALYDGQEVIDTTVHNGLANSLVSMRDQMKKIAEDEKERNWTTEGLARFVEILRGNNNNQQALADSIISNLVNYLHANQGALFIVNDDDINNVHLNMIGCYAYNRKKYLNKQIQPGEGLVGQAFLEKDTIYITDIPKNYIAITSGLGHALPSNVIIVPLKINEDIHGIVEIASFNPIQKYQREFVEKLGESIASTIASVKINERTTRLLAETQQQAEEMRAQEEEMRQNVEELAATQEDMSRVLREVQEKETYMNNLIDATNDAIVTVDRNYIITVANKVFIDTFNAQGIAIQKGDSVFKTMKPELRDQAKSLYDRALNGESIEATKEYFQRHYIVSYNPIKSQDGFIMGVSVYTRDVTEQLKSQKQAEQLLKEQSLRSAVVERNREVLTRLTKSENIQNGNLNLALEEITKAMGEVFGIKRAAVWSYNDKDQSILLEKMFLSAENKFDAGSKFFQSDIPVYFNSVKTEEIIIAKDASVHPSLVEFKVGYLDVLDIRSMLDVPFFLDGRVGGVICCEQQNQAKDWTAEEVDFAKSVADIITIAFKSAEMKKALQESQAKAEEIMAQEEEMRQQMEELQAIQEELARKNDDMESVRQTEKARADQQIAAQKKMMEKVLAQFKEKESAYLSKIQQLENSKSTLIH